MSWLSRLFGKKAPEITASAQYAQPPITDYDGSKFYGGVSSTVDELANLDYWTLRQRSSALFWRNSYARGIIRRLVTNIINAGLELECTPEEPILGLPEDSLMDWAENVETRFTMWAESPDICDIKGYRTFGDIQRAIYMEALVGGDCLVILRQDRRTKMPQLQIISGSRVQSPPLIPDNKTIVDGVEIDANGKHIAYHVYLGTEDVHDDRWIRVPVKGSRTGRRTAWMVYGYDTREDSVRGEPLLSIAIQPLQEIDTYRDSAQRKASINSMIVGFIKRMNDKPGTLAMQGAAVKKSEVTADTTGTLNPVTMAEVMPGVYMERLQPGEEPHPYATSGTDVNFGAFEASIMVGVAWAMEIPPEILMMSFNKNYSASQAANNEFKVVQNRERPRFATEVTQPVYEEVFLSELLLGNLFADGFVEAYRDPKRYAEKRAWLMSNWYGPIKPSVDIVKQTNGYKSMTDNCWITNERACRELNNMKFRKVVAKVAKENELKAAAMRPLLEAQQEFGTESVEEAMALIERGRTDEMADA